MEEIKIIVDTGPTYDISTIPAEEREILFEHLADTYTDIPRYHFNSFNDMQTELFKYENKLIKPEIKELLLRKIIQLSIGRQGAFNTVIIPVIPNLYNITIRKTGSHLPIRRSSTLGAADQRRFRPATEPTKKKIEVPNSIRVRFDANILAITLGGLDYIVPGNEEIDVIGIIINPICTQPRGFRNNDESYILNAVKIVDIDIASMIALGNYTYEKVLRSCQDLFTRPRLSLNIAGENVDVATRLLFADLGNENRMLTVLSAIFEYLVSAEKYSRDDVSALSVHNQVRKAIMDVGKPSVVEDTHLMRILRDVYAARIDGVFRDPEPEKSQLLQDLEKIHENSFSLAFKTNLLSDLFGYGLMSIWSNALIRGRDSDTVRDMLSVFTMRKARNEFQRKLKQQAMDETNKLNIYRGIIERKFGVKKVAEIERQLIVKPSLLIKADNVLGILTPAEKKIVLLEYERRQKYIEALINNDCPHKLIYRRFRTSNSNERTKKLFADLNRFFKRGDDNAMIACNNCGFDIMCPHVKEYTELDLRGANFAEVKGKMAKYIDKALAYDQYFCKICGEVISTSESFGDITGPKDIQSAINEELKTLIWSEIAVLIRYLKFDSLVNIAQLITAARDAIYPYIFEIEKQILKSKTNTADEIKAKKRLFISIYGMAYLVHLILSAKKAQISFKGMKVSDPKKLIIDLIRHALEILVMSKNITIREIHGMTNDIMKAKLIEAYKSISTLGIQVTKPAGETENLLITLLLDPVYCYIYNINMIDEMLNGKYPGRSKFIMTEKLDSYMGGPITVLEGQKDIFEKIKTPRFDSRWHVQDFEKIMPLVRGAITTKDGKSIWANAYRGYIAKSYEIWFERVRGRLFTQYMYIDASVDKKSPDAFLDVRFREHYEKTFAAYRDGVLGPETILSQYKAMEHAKTFWIWNLTESRQWGRPKTSLGRIYDEEGNKHVFNMFVVKNADAKSVDMSSGEIAAMIEKGERFKGEILDKKCSICGAIGKDIDNLDEKKIVMALNVKHEVGNFFRFYENRCPKGNLHDIVNDKCSKCGFILSMLANQTSKVAASYCAEFLTIYRREYAEYGALDVGNLVFPVAKPPIIDDAKWSANYAKWIFKDEILLDLANKLKINFRLLSCIGSIERQDYTEIKTGAFIPPEASFKDDTRIYVINSHIKNLIMDYNTLRFFHRAVKPPADIVSLIDSTGINKHRVAELAKQLPEVFDDYNAKFIWFRRNKKPREIVNFCIQSLCEICLRIWNDTDKETMRLRQGFVDMFMRKTLRAEELLSKPGYFNWSLLFPHENREKDAYDSNLSNEDEKPGYKDESDDENEDFGDTSAPMRSDDLDIDDISKDPDDPDADDGNDIRVGEDLGMT